jgi:hypothetical protein
VENEQDCRDGADGQVFPVGEPFEQRLKA